MNVTASLRWGLGWEKLTPHNTLNASPPPWNTKPNVNACHNCHIFICIKKKPQILHGFTSTLHVLQFYVQLSVTWNPNENALKFYKVLKQLRGLKRPTVLIGTIFVTVKLSSGKLDFSGLFRPIRFTAITSPWSVILSGGWGRRSGPFSSTRPGGLPTPVLEGRRPAAFRCVSGPTHLDDLSMRSRSPDFC